MSAMVDTVTSFGAMRENAVMLGRVDSKFTLGSVAESTRVVDMI